MRYCLFLVSLCFAQIALAQDYMKYFDLDAQLPPEVSIFETVVLEDCTYIRETVNEGSVYLYREGGRDRKEEPTYLNGEEVPAEVYLTDEGCFSVQPNALQAQQMLSIVDNAFTTEQADSLRGWYMFIELRVSSITGDIEDVIFHFATTTPYEKIPIEVFRNIERKMKSELHFEITNFGKSLTYSSLGWAHCPSGRAESDSSTIEESGKLTMPNGGLNTPAGSVGDSIGQP